MKTILCFGDSNTWGSATRPGKDQRYAPHERWPGVLQKTLSAGWTIIAEGLPGRTTVHSDPVEGAWMNGAAYLLPCLRSHRPLDVVALMLGSNDLKFRFSVSATDIAGSIGVLLKIIAQSESGPSTGVPKILVIAPPPILEHFGERPDFVDIFAGGREKSLQLARAYETVAKEHGVAFFDAGTVIRSSAFDGIHLDLDAHAALGAAVAEKLAGLGW